MKNSANDSELWKLFREGDSLAYTKLVETYSRSLYDYGYRIVPDKDFIKDCLQDVFMELWNRRIRINDTASVKNYLFKAIRLRIFRQQSKWSLPEQISEDYHFRFEIDTEASWIENDETDSTLKRLNTILHTLPARQREIIYLRFYENLEFETIAQILNISKQSIYNSLQKSFKKFRAEWLIQLIMLLLTCQVRNF
ncbi:RNA polymerase sigma factor [Mucilaginibacter sp.]|jgi:RNA polymerase sigma factor (sigma-70 family)|uniref:RNA polymerase sigma factor n=1 Tax=Mucilaginibacter sp. TaxID=1882438 RepID=UPI0035618239